jgi:hypothetical protein
MIKPSQDTYQGLGISLPAISQEDRNPTQTGYHLSNQIGGGLSGSWSKPHPQHKHRTDSKGSVNPFDLPRTPLGVHLIKLHSRYFHILYNLFMVGLGPLAGYLLKPMQSLYIHLADVGCSFIAHPPPLTLQKPDHLLFWQLGVGHQCTFPFGKLSFTDGASQAFDMLMLARPRAVVDVALARLIEKGTLQIWARELAILIFRRSRHHFGPPLIRLRPKYTNSTPVFLR